jgi:hypothetical protein
LKIVLDVFDVNPAHIRFVVVMEFEAVRLFPITNEFRLEIEITFSVVIFALVPTIFVVTRFAKGCIIFDEFMFEIVLP